jgi:hypothetical protein
VVSTSDLYSDFVDERATHVYFLVH